MSIFRDRRQYSVEPLPRTKTEINGHLVNDHEYLQEGAGNSGRNLPSKDELEAQHERLHAAGQIHGGHRHGPDAPPRMMSTDELFSEAENISRNVPLKYDNKRLDAPTKRHMQLSEEYYRRPDGGA